jgi:hypothetical protein
MRLPLPLLCALVACAAAGTGCAASSRADANQHLEHVVNENHLIAVAYRAQASAQRRCVHGMRTGLITSDNEAAQCLADGLTASGLERTIDRYRRDVIQMGESGSDACRHAATQLALVVAEEERYIHESHDDLERMDANAYSDDGMHAGEAAARETGPIKAMERACANR